MSFREFYSQQELEKYQDFVKQLTDAAGQCGARIKSLGKIGEEFDLYRVDVNPDAEKTILIGATMHGNEPSGAYGTVEFLKKHEIPKNVRLIILPLMNPHGFVKDIRTASNKVDLNRAFRAKEFQNEGKLIRDTLADEKINLLVSLHEDDGADGFYVYCPEGQAISVLQPLLKIAEKHFPIVDADKFRQEKMEKGVIVMADNNKSPHNVKSFEYWVRQQNDKCYYVCTEVPTKFSLEKRVECVREMLNWSVGKLFPKICKKA